MTEAELSRVVGKHEGRAYLFLGRLAIFKITGEETNGAYALMEAVAPPGAQAHWHTHLREHENFYVLEGELEIGLGDETVRVGPGGFVESPPGQPHRVANPGPGNARYLATLVPAGFEGFIAELGEPVPPTHEVVATGPPKDIQRLIDTALRYGVLMPGQPLPTSWSDGTQR